MSNNILFRKQITIAENRIQKATSQLEIAWLYHDLSRYYLEINKFDLARVYARKCIVEAKQCNNLEWVINAKLLITRINIQQHNRTDAKMEVNAAIELAKQMENDTLREYLEKVSVFIFMLMFKRYDKCNVNKFICALNCRYNDNIVPLSAKILVLYIDCIFCQKFLTTAIH